VVGSTGIDRVHRSAWLCPGGPIGVTRNAYAGLKTAWHASQPDVRRRLPRS
jgi:hypothetical protein